jgi:Cu/Zn superoxide dismutase
MLCQYSQRTPSYAEVRSVSRGFGTDATGTTSQKHSHRRNLLARDAGVSLPTMLIVEDVTKSDPTLAATKMGTGTGIFLFIYVNLLYKKATHAFHYQGEITCNPSPKQCTEVAFLQAHRHVNLLRFLDIQ